MVFLPPLRFSLLLQECERQLLFAHRIQEGFQYDVVEGFSCKAFVCCCNTVKKLLA
jgi:hypothetical protein